MFKGKDPKSLNESVRSIDGQINHPEIPYEGPEVGNLEWLRSTIDDSFPIEGINAQGNSKPSFVQKPDSLIGKWLKKLKKVA